MGRYTLREISPLAWALAAVAALGVAILFVTTVNHYAKAAIDAANKCSARIEKIASR